MQIKHDHGLKKTWKQSNLEKGLNLCHGKRIKHGGRINYGKGIKYGRRLNMAEGVNRIGVLESRYEDSVFGVPKNWNIL